VLLADPPVPATCEHVAERLGLADFGAGVAGASSIRRLIRLRVYRSAASWRLRENAQRRPDNDPLAARPLRPGRRPSARARTRTAARSADAQSPRPRRAAGQSPAAGPPRSPARQPGQRGIPRSWPAHGPLHASGIATCDSVLPAWPSCPPGLRPLFFRSGCVFGGGLPSPSDDGCLHPHSAGNQDRPTHRSGRRTSPHAWHT